MPRSEGRRLALEALLERYAEIDPRAAVGVVRQDALGTDLLAGVYATWAAKDASAALDALRDVESPAVAEAIGIALLPVLGNDDLAITRIAGSATSIDPDRLRVEALAARAEADPAAALDEALKLPPSFERMAVDRIADIWAHSDIEAALRGAAGLPPGPRAELRSSLLRSWARSEPDAALGYLRDLDAGEQQQLLQSGGLTIFGLIDPEKALAVALELPGDAGRMARSFALQSFASVDPLAALARVEQLPSRIERDQLMSVVAAGYARADPEAALAWAQSLRPPQSNVLFTVLSAVARTDPDRALDIALSLPADPGPGLGPQAMLIAAQLMVGAADPEKIANRVLDVTDRTLREQTLSAMTRQWSVRDPAAALRWLVENADRVPSSSLLQAAEQLARTDPAAASGYTSQIANDLRGAWLGAVAAGYAQNDPEAALSWVVQYRDQPGYQTAVAAIVQRAADYEPALAARLLESMEATAPEYFGAVSAIAYAWGRQSPRDAAQWAADLHDDVPRRNALSAVLQEWSAADPATARAWVLGMPGGEARDAARVPLVLRAATSGETIDRPLVDAFSKEDMRRQALMQAISVLAPRDRDAASRLADEYLNDPALQAQARRMIEVAENRPTAAGVRFFGPLPAGINAVATGVSAVPSGAVVMPAPVGSSYGPIMRIAPPVPPFPGAVPVPPPASVSPATLLP
jgi:hypothetical protein